MKVPLESGFWSTPSRAKNNAPKKIWSDKRMNVFCR
jgi:hypothetical protein